MGDQRPAEPKSGKPPHPGSAWQQCVDQNTGYPYYWNVHTNQVRWDCPPELLQYQQHSSKADKPAVPAKTALVSGYDSDEEGSDEDGADVNGDSGDVAAEAGPEFIGPVRPAEPPPPGETAAEEAAAGEVELLNKLKEKSAVLKSLGGDINEDVKQIIAPDHLTRMEQDIATDIISKIEAEKPPDYKKAAEGAVGNNKQQLTAAVNSISLLAGYGGDDSADDETDDEKFVTMANGKQIRSDLLLPMTSTSFWKTDQDKDSAQTDEQKQALSSYSNQETSRPGQNDQLLNSRQSRKRRIGLPGGKNQFNKNTKGDADVPEETEEASASKATKFQAVMFVKSDTSLPGSIDEPKEEGQQEKEPEPEPVSLETKTETSDNSKGTSSGNISSLAEEVVDKLEHFQVNQEKISTLKTVAVKIETLYSAWSAGALTPDYLSAVLMAAQKTIRRAELDSACPHPWTLTWDRSQKKYKYQNGETGEVRDQLPSSQENGEALDPPLPPPEEAPPLPPPGPPPTVDHRLQDMDIDEEDNSEEQQQQQHTPDIEQTSSITDELNSFYSSLSPVKEDPDPDPVHSPSPAIPTETDSRSSSPLNVDNNVSKKRKKPKVSNTLALKKKGVGGMLAKWQNLQN